MDAIRKQLDVLMGANRNGDVTEVDRKYSDRDVCRLFLAGLCPHDLFQLTKMDLGPCPKVHSLQLRKDYEEGKAKSLHNFDRDLEDLIERLIVECERKIQRALKRLEDEDAKAAIAISVSQVTQTPEVLELSKLIKEKLKEVDAFDLEGKTDNKIRAQEALEELRTKRADKQAMLLLDAFNKDRASLPQPQQNTPQLAPVPAPNPPDPRTQEMINEKLKKAEDLGEKGMIDEAQKALEEAEALKKLSARQEPAADSSKYTAVDVRITDQKLRVCDICGAFLSVYDSDRRLADHFGGKLHLGYMQIREKLAELQTWSKDEALSLRRKEICLGRESNLRTEGPWNIVERTEVTAGKEDVNMIDGVGSMIGTMIGVGGMTVNALRIQADLAIMIPEADEDLALALRNVLEIMIGTGVMIDAEASPRMRRKSWSGFETEFVD